jgi:DNA modification methylase
LKIINSDWVEGLKTLENESVQCCVTSPPYWGLRDYGVKGQIGLEETPEEYVANYGRGIRRGKAGAAG